MLKYVFLISNTSHEKRLSWVDWEVWGVLLGFSPLGLGMNNFWMNGNY